MPGRGIARTDVERAANRIGGHIRRTPVAEVEPGSRWFKPGVAADSLGATRIGDIAYEVATRTEVVSLLVEDADIIEARRLLWERHRLVVEHGTAAAFAALHTGGYRPDSGERVAVVLCGANTDPFDL